MTYTLTLVGPLWTVNAERNKHWSARSTLTKHWRTEAFYAAKRAQIPHLDRIRIDAYPKQAKGKLADTNAHNGVVKACVDGLVDAGVIPNDTGTEVVCIAGWAVERSTHKSMTGLLDELVLVIEPA